VEEDSGKKWSYLHQSSTATREYYSPRLEQMQHIAIAKTDIILCIGYSIHSFLFILMIMKIWISVQKKVRIFHSSIHVPKVWEAEIWILNWEVSLKCQFPYIILKVRIQFCNLSCIRGKYHQGRSCHCNSSGLDNGVHSHPFCKNFYTIAKVTEIYLFFLKVKYNIQNIS